MYRSVAGSEVRSYGYPLDLYVRHPSLEYSLRPNFRGAFSHTGFADIAVNVNSEGYRDSEFSVERTAGVRRVVLLGDSVSFGSGVRARDRFSDLIEGAASEVGASRRGPPPRKSLEIFNLSVNSYTFFHYLEQVRSVVPRFDPDEVWIGFCLNDIAPKENSGPRHAVLTAEEGALGYQGYRPETWLDRAEKVSAVFWLGRELVDASELTSRQHAWDRWIDRTEKAWNSVELLAQLEIQVMALRDEVRAQDRALRVLILPVRHDVVNSSRYSGPRRKLLSLLERAGVGYQDLHSTFEAAPEISSLFLSGDAVHLTPRGHALVASALVDVAKPAPGPVGLGPLSTPELERVLPRSE